MTESLDQWMTVPEAARLKDVAESSVRTAINTGRLTGKKIGPTYLVLRKDVEAWVVGRQGPKRGRKGGEYSIAAAVA